MIARKLSPLAYSLSSFFVFVFHLQIFMDITSFYSHCFIVKILFENSKIVSELSKCRIYWWRRLGLIWSEEKINSWIDLGGNRRRICWLIDFSLAIETRILPLPSLCSYSFETHVYAGTQWRLAGGYWCWQCFVIVGACIFFFSYFHLILFDCKYFLFHLAFCLFDSPSLNRLLSLLLPNATRYDFAHVVYCVLNSILDSTIVSRRPWEKMRRLNVPFSLESSVSDRICSACVYLLPSFLYQVVINGSSILLLFHSCSRLSCPPLSVSSVSVCVRTFL